MSAGRAELPPNGDGEIAEYRPGNRSLERLPVKASRCLSFQIRLSLERELLCLRLRPLLPGTGCSELPPGEGGDLALYRPCNPSLEPLSVKASRCLSSHASLSIGRERRVPVLLGREPEELPPITLCVKHYKSALTHCFNSYGRRILAFCRSQSRALSVARLSCCFLPLASPMSTLALPFDQCRFSATSV